MIEQSSDLVGFSDGADVRLHNAWECNGGVSSAGGVTEGLLG